MKSKNKRQSILSFILIASLFAQAFPCVLAAQITPPSSNGKFGEPLTRALQRITKKPFGIFVTPFHSPVRPERFQGYHTGVDFEILPGEEKKAVTVRAICTGQLLLKNQVSGYGGVVAESCLLDKKPITVVYGHLNIKSVLQKKGDHLLKGGIIGLLGKGYSTETAGERKHLHLGIHKGSGIDLRGYVSNKKELTQWIDVSKYLQ